MSGILIMAYCMKLWKNSSYETKNEIKLQFFYAAAENVIGE